MCFLELWACRKKFSILSTEPVRNYLTGDSLRSEQSINFNHSSGAFVGIFTSDFVFLMQVNLIGTLGA